MLITLLLFFIYRYCSFSSAPAASIPVLTVIATALAIVDAVLAGTSSALAA